MAVVDFADLPGVAGSGLAQYRVDVTPRRDGRGQRGEVEPIHQRVIGGVYPNLLLRTVRRRQLQGGRARFEVDSAERERPVPPQLFHHGVYLADHLRRGKGADSDGTDRPVRVQHVQGLLSSQTGRRAHVDLPTGARCVRGRRWWRCATRAQGGDQYGGGSQRRDAESALARTTPRVRIRQRLTQPRTPAATRRSLPDCSGGPRAPRWQVRSPTPGMPLRTPTASPRSTGLRP